MCTIYFYGAIGWLIAMLMEIIKYIYILYYYVSYFECLEFVKCYNYCAPGVSVATCMAILQVGSGLQLRSASTGSKEEDYENDAATIVQKCVSRNT